jgi:hypothetical protein
MPLMPRIAQPAQFLAPRMGDRLADVLRSTRPTCRSVLLVPYRAQSGFASLSPRTEASL